MGQTVPSNTILYHWIQQTLAGVTFSWAIISKLQSYQNVKTIVTTIAIAPLSVASQWESRRHFSWLGRNFGITDEGENGQRYHILLVALLMLPWTEITKRWEWHWWLLLSIPGLMTRHSCPSKECDGVCWKNSLLWRSCHHQCYWMGHQMPEYGNSERDA